MSTTQNLELLRRMVIALNAQDIEAHDEFWREDLIWHGPPGFGDIHGLKAFKDEVLKPFYEAFPDYHGSIDIKVAQGDWIAATGYVTGTHHGEWLGVAPTGKPMKMRYSDFWLIKDGLFVENWVMVDHIDVMRQLGIDILAQTGEA